MIAKIVFLALFAIASATENDQEIEKARFIDLDPLGIIDEAMNGAGRIAFLVKIVAIAVISFAVLGRAASRIEYRRNDELDHYQQGYTSEDQYLQNRYKRFAANGKVYL